MLESLNDKQLEAVLHTNGPLLVIAGAGSGKTKALTHRITYLMNEKSVSPWNILAVTFTNKAANEMKERIVKLVANEQNSLWGDQNLPSIGTFHSTCVRILRKYIHHMGYENTFVIYDTADQQVLMKRVMRDMSIDEKQFNPRTLLGQISAAKNELITAEKYRHMISNSFTEKVAEVYREYSKALVKNNALDFDDIIMKTVELLQTQPKVLDDLQEKFQYISVDEYQDTNHAQYVLTNLLAQKYRNLCVIGDSDQSIYSFRGANISNILNFEKDYPDAKIVLLEQNYRSTQFILDAAHSIIVKNNQRKDKKLWTEREGGEKIKMMELDNERIEGEFIAREIKDRLLQYEYPHYKDFAILYRTNAQSRTIEEVFLRHAIPYKIVGGIKFYERKEVKDVIAYLRVIQNPSDSVSLLRIINTPPRKIGPKTLEQVQTYAFLKDITLFEAMERAHEIEELAGTKALALMNFIQLIRDLQKINLEFSASGVIKHVVDYTGYKDFLNDGSVEGESRLENIYELISVANKYDKLEASISLNVFLEEVALIADVDSYDTDDNAVTMMTIHSAKGLEFPIVFLIGLEEGVLPHSRSLLQRSELEEERRLMYVAITRAMDKLYLLRARTRMLYGETQSNSPSQFLMDIPVEVIEADEKTLAKIIKSTDLSYTPIPVEDYEENYEEVYFEPGDRVFHQSFGEGEVTAIMGGVATIKFDNIRYGIKRLALSIAPLKKL